MTPSTQTLSMPTVLYYASLADRKERDPVNEDNGRATVPMGRGFQKWRRFNSEESLVWICDAEGKDRWLTRKQADILDLSLSLADDPTVTVRRMAGMLNVSPSTISRALLKLVSFGLICVVGSRGRYASMIILRRINGDGLDRFRQVALGKLLKMKKAAEDRLSRLAFIVATMNHGREDEDKYLSYTPTDTSTRMSATLKPHVIIQPPFMPEMGDGLEY